ncbi:MAG: type II secretion system protein J [Chthoniobacteraceae bacterium]
MSVSPFHPQWAKGPSAFTLIEALSAIVVFSLLILMLTQIIGISSQTIAFNAKKLDSVGQARLVMDRIAADLCARPRRSDLGMLFQKTHGNDSLLFYSETNGYSGSRHLSLIEYRVQENTAGRVFQLERGATGVSWNGTGQALVFLPTALPTPAPTDYEVLAPGVFRMEICFLLNPTSSSSPGQLSNSANSDFSNVAAIVVAIAVIDEKSRALLSHDQLGQLSAAFLDNTEGQYPITSWSTALNQTVFAPGIPRQAIQGVHLYQRIFNVP